MYSGHRYFILLVIRAAIYTLASTITKVLMDCLTVKHCRTVTKQISITIMHHRLRHSCRFFLVCIQLPKMDNIRVELIPDIVALT